MKVLTTIFLLTVTMSTFAQNEICGRFIVSEDLYEGRPANEYLGVAYTATAWDKYYLKPRSERQRANLKKMKPGKYYCVTGALSWCGKNTEFKCITLQSVRIN